MEAIWIAAEMRAGAAYAHSVIALDALGEAVVAADTAAADTRKPPAGTR